MYRTKIFGCLKTGTLSFRAEMPEIGRISGISDPESTFCPVFTPVMKMVKDFSDQPDAILM
ncbi:hypothetical protein QUF72_12120 [Desulfobacterales bacterium HSG2]|nr:hypothetical protein [Desulfobacterales bacterium HSG2]